MEKVNTKLDDINLLLILACIRDKSNQKQNNAKKYSLSIESLASEICPVAFESNQQTERTETSRCRSKYGVCGNNDDVTQNDSLETKSHKCDVCDYSSNKKKYLSIIRWCTKTLLKCKCTNATLVTMKQSFRIASKCFS